MIAFFDTKYGAPTRTTSMRKLPIVARMVTERRLATLSAPPPLDVECLRQLHDPAYVDAYLAGEEPRASSSGFEWTPQIRDGVLAINAGQIAGAQEALRSGLSANIAQGFHHARYDRGAGFCTFNGLALVAAAFPDRRIAVLDCDQHGGDGTEEFVERLPNLFNVTINGSRFGCTTKERNICLNLPPVTRNFSPYQNALKQAGELIEQWQPDLVIYQAGADVHEDDPLGTLGMTTEQMYERDQWAFEFARSRSLPILFVLAGGYQEPIETRLAPLHVQTFAAAQQVFGTRQPAPPL